MSKEILLVVESVSNEKGVPEEVIIDALEVALATATKKRYDEGVELRVIIDKESGEYETFRVWDAVKFPVQSIRFTPYRMSAPFLPRSQAASPPRRTVLPPFPRCPRRTMYPRVSW